jgi:hypothetical protein
VGEQRTPVVAAVVVALVVGVVAWLLLRGDDEQHPGQGHAARTLSPRLVSPDQLKTYAAAGGPIYWAGTRQGTLLEFSRRPNGAFVRYLPGRAEAGDKRARLTVGTYALRSALAAVSRSGHAKGARLTRLPRGGVAVTNAARPTNAYFAYPGRAVQVEVFDPRPGRALELIRPARIVPLATR